MPGYLSGLSSPSGTERIMMERFSPKSKSTGHTRFPTFSIKITSMASSPTASSNASTAWPIMFPSRWQRPPVLIWMAGMPASFMRTASTSEAISPSMTAQRSPRAAKRSFVARMVLVLPDPGLESTLTTYVPVCANRSRSSVASRSLRERMGCSKAIVCSAISSLLIE